ncbi:unnamed protein product [Thlaspi arvense]|uniref:Phytocyanin domain-containing protein n=1 Tax=Thlaspi arvense TaxID=13288 RepID=A0AAU9SH84_THLAR|nr:unnamed protein product [Thlaspi arvense]
MARSSGHVSYVASTVPIAIVMTVLCLLLANNVSHARRPATYYVGGKFGWDTIIPMDSWARGKTFYAGDILVFKYDDDVSRVVVVNRTGYETCIPNAGSKEYESGNDRIQLPYGYSYYIGTYNEYDCAAGEKMAIKALAPK